MNPSSQPRKQQIPVIVLAGFLGSGKTTLLNHLLRNRAGNRIGVIVNDFGAIEIDAMTVSGQVGSTVSARSTRVNSTPSWRRSPGPPPVST